jgi:hypothetical protein
MLYKNLYITDVDSRGNRSGKSYDAQVLETFKKLLKNKLA